MSAREVALGAYQESVRTLQDTQARQQAEAERQAREKHDRATETLQASPLAEWFPGVEWDLMDYAHHGAAAGYGDGSSIVVADPERQVWLMVERRGESERLTDPMVNRRSQLTKVYAVSSAVDSETSYSYWSGPEVSSPAEVGASVAAREHWWKQHTCKGCPGLHSRECGMPGRGIALRECRARERYDR